MQCIHFITWTRSPVSVRDGRCTHLRWRSGLSSARSVGAGPTLEAVERAEDGSSVRHGSLSAPIPIPIPILNCDPGLAVSLARWRVHCLWSYVTKENRERQRQVRNTLNKCELERRSCQIASVIRERSARRGWSPGPALLGYSDLLCKCVVCVRCVRVYSSLPWYSPKNRKLADWSEKSVPIE